MNTERFLANKCDHNWISIGVENEDLLAFDKKYPGFNNKPHVISKEWCQLCHFIKHTTILGIIYDLFGDPVPIKPSSINLHKYTNKRKITL